MEVESRSSRPEPSGRTMKDEECKEVKLKSVNIRNGSLVYLCQSVIVSNLERYPPESFGICDELLWDELIELRHKKTKPKEGTGGLDGTGRMVPAVTDKFLEAVENTNQHLSESNLVDGLVWRDCVEYRFRRGGLTRPHSLMYPWPVLVEYVSSTADSLRLSDSANDEEVDSAVIGKALDILSTIPVNLSLLRDSFVGKTVKKILKKPHPNFSNDALKQLKCILDSWISYASDAGVEMKGSLSNTNNDNNPRKEEAAELDIAETCLNWRQLFVALKKREDEMRSSQGKRMREIRRNLAETRPKLVKVRPNNPKHERIMSRTAGGSPWRKETQNSSSGATNKLMQVRKETFLQSKCQRQMKSAPKPSFAEAVAFASKSKSTSNKSKASSTIRLEGNRQMKIPTQIVKGSGPRQLASKWKTPRRL